MTQERINEAIKAWQKISDACAASTDIDWILNSSKDARCFYCFDVEHAEHCEVYWLNVDEIICAEVFCNKGGKEWQVSPHIEIIDPEINDWDGIDYNVQEL